ncbi:NAD(P)-dependent oxidoreductase [Echinicola sp. 20G]|uniref:NAD-dependent epimerase/dehydratase family protein n=1 Tax=Echinicola sp. 20G TaxID=2781961 RepID=UPI0019108851|nr:NAD(P)-dependent oxidoreductase [Echinicola sp. 20G]
MKKILITGLNGFLGSHLASVLSDSNYDVIGLVRRSSDLNRVGKERYRLYFSDEKYSLDQLFDENEIFAVIHTATIYRAKETVNELIDTNLKLPVQLMEYVEKYKVKLFINTDTFFNNESSNYNYLGNYTLSKKHCIEWLRDIQESCTLVNMKLHHIYGPYDSDTKFVTNITKKISEGVESISLTDCTQKRDFIYISDVCKAYEKVIDNFSRLKKYSEFEVGTGVSTSVYDFITKIKELSNSSSVLRFGDLPQREGEPMFNQADVSALEHLGWFPEYSLDEGINELLKSF